MSTRVKRVSAFDLFRVAIGKTGKLKNKSFDEAKGNSQYVGMMWRQAPPTIRTQFMQLALQRNRDAMRLRSTLATRQSSDEGAQRPADMSKSTTGGSAGRALSNFSLLMKLLYQDKVLRDGLQMVDLNKVATATLPFLSHQDASLLLQRYAPNQQAEPSGEEEGERGKKLSAGSVTGNTVYDEFCGQSPFCFSTAQKEISFRVYACAKFLHSPDSESWEQHLHKCHARWLTEVKLRSHWRTVVPDVKAFDQFCLMQIVKYPLLLQFCRDEKWGELRKFCFQLLCQEGGAKLKKNFRVILPVTPQIISFYLNQLKEARGDDGKKRKLLLYRSLLAKYPPKFVMKSDSEAHQRIALRKRVGGQTVISPSVYRVVAPQNANVSSDKLLQKLREKVHQLSSEYPGFDHLCAYEQAVLATEEMRPKKDHANILSAYSNDFHLKKF